jgi:TonB family protein
MSNTPQDAGRTLRIADRRLHARRRVLSLAYVELTENNGGIILNISEGGLVVTAAAPLGDVRLPRMRFQLPGSNDWIEASGEIAWISQSKRAGIRFIDLTEENRNRIRTWLSSESSRVEFHRGRGRVREKDRQLLEMSSARESKSVIPQAMKSVQVVRELAQVSELKPEVTAAERSMNSVVHSRSWGNLAAVVMLVAFGSFLVGWFAAGQATRDKIVGMFTSKTLVTRELAKAMESPPAGATATVPSSAVQDALPQRQAAELSPATTVASIPRSSAQNAHPQTAERPPPTTAANAAGPPAYSARAGARSPAPVPASNAAQVPSPRVESVHPQGDPPPPPNETSSVSPSPNLEQPEGERTTGPGEKENSPPPKPAQNPEVVKGSVSVSFSPYPSIRVPAELRSQMSRQGASLQIGQLILRVDPIYPEDAERQRVEGTVKLHAIIGRDGAVQSVEPTGGPASLVPAAASAVRQWRYKPASLGGQPVEAEEDISIVFRLLDQAAHPN